MGGTPASIMGSDDIRILEGLPIYSSASNLSLTSSSQAWVLSHNYMN